MIQRGEDFRFALKTCEPIAVSGEGVGQDLDRHLTAEGRVRRAVHRPHAALADLGCNFVDADPSARSEGQCRGDYRGWPADARAGPSRSLRSRDSFLQFFLPVEYHLDHLSAGEARKCGLSGWDDSDDLSVWRDVVVPDDGRTTRIGETHRRGIADGKTRVRRNGDREDVSVRPRIVVQLLAIG